MEDDNALAEMLEYNLQQEGYKTRVVDDGLKVISEVNTFKPDLILLDIMLPGIDGFEVCKRLKADERTAGIPVIILTVKSGEVDVVLGLELGADDYVTKPFSVRVLLARIKKLLQKKEEKPPARICYYSLVLDNEKRKVFSGNRPVPLSRTEFDILALLISKPGKVFSRETILRRCWPEGIYVIDRAIDVHINSLRKKLGKMGEYIETVRGIGYRAKE